MRKIYRSLSFIILPSIISVSAQAFSLNDVTSSLGITSEEASNYHTLCDDFPMDSRRGTICRQYPSDKVRPVAKLPASKDLESNALYLLSADDTIDAPYQLPEGVGILPTPTIGKVTLTPTGSGTDDDCGLCVMKFAEGTKVAGLSVNMSASSWKPTPGKGKEKAVFYGSTSNSEFSESTIWGRSDFVDVVHQQMTVNGDNMQSYHGLVLYAEGSQNLLRVENADNTSAVSIPKGNKWHVDIVNSIGTLSGNIPSSAEEQGAFVLNNLVGTIYSSSVFYEPLGDSQVFDRYGVMATDTPALYLNRVGHKVTQKGYSRDEDIEEIYRNSLQSGMSVFSDNNSYFVGSEHYINALKDQLQLTYYLGNNEEYASTDVDTSSESISNLTSNGAFFLGNTQQLKALCAVNSDDYSAAPVNGIDIQAGPANSTTEDLNSYCVANAQSTACNRSLTDRVIDWSIGAGGGVVVTGAITFMIWCICRSVGKSNKNGYVQIQGRP